MACRASSWRRRGSTATMPPHVLEQQAQFRVRAQRAPQAARQRVAHRRRAGRHDRCEVARRLRAARAARPALRPADAVVAPAPRRRALPPTIPDTQIILNHTGLPADRSRRRHRGLACGDGDARAATERRREDLGHRPARRSMDSGRESRHRAHRDRPLRHRALHVREQLPGRQPVRDASRRSSTASARSCPTFRPSEQRALFRDNAIRIYDIAMKPTPGLRRRRPHGPADGQAAGAARLRDPRVRHRASAGGGRAGRRRARPRRPRRMRRAAPISFCSTCRRPTPWKKRCSAPTASRARSRRRSSSSISRRSRSTRAARSPRGCATAPGCGWIDAPVSGGPPASGSGTLTVMMGGDDADVARVMPFMKDVSSRCTHMGPAGAGLAAKMINQLIVGCTHAVMAEALLVAESGGHRRRAHSRVPRRRPRRRHAAAAAVSAHGRARLRAAGLRAPAAEGPRDGQRVRRRR